MNEKHLKYGNSFMLKRGRPCNVCQDKQATVEIEYGNYGGINIVALCDDCVNDLRKLLEKEKL